VKKVYLIRHGLPDFPGGHRMCLGSTDLPLGETGRAQARAMAQSLPPVTAVFSSPLIRAVQTAEPIAMPITVLDGLREMYAGEWDGLTFDQIRAQYPALYAARGTNPQLPLPGAETEESGLARFCKAMEQAAVQAPGDFAVVAHGGVISLFLEQLTRTRTKPQYAQVISLRYENDTFIAL
jgi:probable phosphoglycerate mutase